MSTGAGYAGRLKREIQDEGDTSPFVRLVRPLATSVMASTVPAAGRQETSLARGLGKKRVDGPPVIDRSSGVALSTPSTNMMDADREDEDYGVEWRTNVGAKDSDRIGSGNLLFRGGKVAADSRMGSSSFANGATAMMSVAGAVTVTAPRLHVDLANPVERIDIQDRKMARALGLGGSTNGDRLAASTNAPSTDLQASRRDNIIVKRGKPRNVTTAMHNAVSAGNSQEKTGGRGKSRVGSSGGPGGTTRGKYSVRGHHQRNGETLDKTYKQIKNAHHHASTGPGPSPSTQNFKVKPSTTSASSSINSSTSNGVNRIPVLTQRRTSGASSSSNSTDGDGQERAVTDEGTEDSGSGSGKAKRRRHAGRSPTPTPSCKAQQSPDGPGREGPELFSSDAAVSGRRSRRRLDVTSDASAAATAAPTNSRLAAGAASAAVAAAGMGSAGLAAGASCTNIRSGGGSARIAGGLGNGGFAPAKKRGRTSSRDSGGGSGTGGSGSGNGVSGGRVSSGRGGSGSGRGRGKGRGRGRGRRKGVSLLESLAPRGPSNKARDTLRWRTHRMVEDYVNTCGNIMYPRVTVGPFGYNPSEGRFPLERPSILGMMRAEIRRPTVIEKWSPYQVALFEGAISIHGKVFDKVAQEVEGKTVGEVVEFYYMWKKTHHYKLWKSMWRAEQAILQAHEVDSDEEDEEEEEEDEEEAEEARGGDASRPGSSGRDFERNLRAEARSRKNGAHGRGGS